MVFAVLALLFPVMPGLAQGPAHTTKQAAQGNPSPQGTPSIITIETGDIDSSEARIIDQMAKALNQSGNIRIMPVLGQGSVQSIGDLLALKIDAAIVQYDVLAQFKKTQRIPLIQNKLQYIAKLYSQELHVLSRMQYLCLADLDGRKVSFGPKGSGAALTAELVFDAHKVKAQPLYLEQDAAFEKLKKGEIDALVYVGGKPAPLFQRIKYTDRVHFLDVDYSEALQEDYLPGIMTHDDYPDLIAPDETVSTISVGSVLTMAGQRRDSEQFRRMGDFVDAFFSNFDQLKSQAFHGKWQEVNLLAPIQGWTRFPGAQSWLELNGSKLTKAEATPTSAAASPAVVAGEGGGQNNEQMRAMLKKFLETQGVGSNADTNELFDQFVRWYEKQNKQ